jgi:mannosyltransferase OCH1-like enzyme
MWIGPKLPPLKMMKTWKDKHPQYEYIFWNETELQNQNMSFCCLDKINDIREICGKVDIMRWEILYKYGGIFIDADSICIEPIDELITEIERENGESCGFASYENENCRNGLVANGTMGFSKNHPLCGDIIEYILNSPTINDEIAQYRAWFSVGPSLLTRFLQTGKYPDIVIYPSYYFLPCHFTGDTYSGHRKVYACQEWGSTFSSYEKMGDISVSPLTTPPPPGFG